MNYEYWRSQTSSSSTGYWMKPQVVVTRGEVTVGEILEEMVKITEEQEEDREKHLPIFDPEDLDI